jgi:hypothetical protein
MGSGHIGDGGVVGQLLDLRLAEHGMAHAVHARVRMQPPRGEAPRNRSRAESHLEQLPARQDTVLGGGEVCELLLGESRSLSDHHSPRSTHTRSTPRIASQRTPGSPQVSATAAAEHARRLSTLVAEPSADPRATQAPERNAARGATDR